MKVFVKTLLIISLLFSYSQISIAISKSDQNIANKLTELMKEENEKQGFFGTILIAKGDEILYQGASGMASLRYHYPNNIDTKFNLGSITKSFTAVAIAQLAENGKLNLEDNIGKYLKDWVSPQVAKKIKIRHLLNHTSGLGNFMSKKFWYYPRIAFKETKDYKFLVKDDKPKFTPGQYYKYSNSGFLLLGAIIENVSGESYHEYIQKNIFDKADMKNTGFYSLDEPVENLAIGYSWEMTGTDIKWRNNYYQQLLIGNPASSAYSTVGDLFKFSQALQKYKLISKKYFQLFTTQNREENAEEYAYGFMTEDRSDAVGHTGSMPGARAYFYMYFDKGYTLAILSNKDSGGEQVLEEAKYLIYSNGS